MKYAAGDKAVVRADLATSQKYPGEGVGGAWVRDEMLIYAGETVTITEVDAPRGIYHIKEDSSRWWWTLTMFEAAGSTSDPTEPKRDDESVKTSSSGEAKQKYKKEKRVDSVTPSTLFAAPGPSFILDMADKPKSAPQPKKISIPNPKDIKAFLDQYVIGQEVAKRTLSVAIHNHYVRLTSKSADEVEIQKSNILMVGNSGSGKTLLAQTIAKFLDVPFVSVDITSFTPAGIVGDDIEDVPQKLLDAAHGDADRAAMGIVYIDEIDKIASSAKSSGVDVKGVLGGATQASLLKLLEGDSMQTSKKRSMFGESSSTVSLKNVLFICGGAFAGIESLLPNSNGFNSRGIGFCSSIIAYKPEEKTIADIGTTEIIKYGMMPEIVGRLPVLVKLLPLTKPDLKAIMTQPKNAIVKQYQRLLAVDNVDLQFSDDALDAVAQMAIDRNVGARGLRGIVEGVMTNVIFEIPDSKVKSKCTITSEHVINCSVPEIVPVAE